jgi:hypothetical protein
VLIYPQMTKVMMVGETPATPKPDSKSATDAKSKSPDKPAKDTKKDGKEKSSG